VEGFEVMKKAKAGRTVRAAQTGHIVAWAGGAACDPAAGDPATRRLDGPEVNNFNPSASEKGRALTNSPL
jgi:hypothetical protein